ncbi:carbohydrate ABC transporter permease [Candidatus Parvarchaeota archaeon]|nr:carbohydrate ABC transporter permease [Candidatus Parvarchaeota archaeon]
MEIKTINKIKKIVLYAVAILVAILFIYPLYILLLVSFSPTTVTLDKLLPSQLPVKLTLNNFISALTQYNFVGPLFKSLEVAFMVGAITLAIAIPAAYGLSKLNRRTGNLIMVFLFIANLVPALIIAIPISVEFIKAGMFDSPLALALAQSLFTLPLATFILLGSFRTIPKDLENQARVDGMGLFRTIYTMLVPMAKAGVAAAFLLSWLTSWDEFTFAVILSPLKPTLPVIVYINITEGSLIQAAAFAAVVSIPVIILTIVLQKYIRGIYLTGGITG